MAQFYFSHASISVRHRISYYVVHISVINREFLHTYSLVIRYAGRRSIHAANYANAIEILGLNNFGMHVRSARIFRSGSRGDITCCACVVLVISTTAHTNLFRIEHG